MDLSALLRLIGIDGSQMTGIPADAITEIRLRSGQKMLLRTAAGAAEIGPEITHARLMEILQALTENSFYAHEHEMLEGYFSIPGGFRVGVCGRLVCRDGIPAHVGELRSVCIRIPHEVRGCADDLAGYARRAWPVSVLVASPPGMGKTTLLRDYLRQISDSGIQCAVVDERREIAACAGGAAQMDVGRNTDIADGCAKALVIPSLIRACAPELIVLDEIGSAGDAEAIRDAARCGVAVAASAHAGSMDELKSRRYIGDLIRDGIFDRIVLLGNRPGQVAAVLNCLNGVEKTC